MREFDTSSPLWVSPEYAKEMIQNAWICQLRGDSYISQLIRLGTQGVHSHSAMFRRDENDHVDMLELREGVGGRTKPFAYHMRKPGRIDVFSPNADNRWPEFDPAGAVAAMRDLTICDYGWLGLFRMLVRRVPLLWRLYPPTTDDRLPQNGESIRQPFCSHAVSMATHLGGEVDPVARRPHYQVTPMNLTESLFYNYEFTIATDWCREKYRANANIDALVACNEHAFGCPEVEA